jgi:glycosyltransferase involved in cell wall biosynthesis
MKISLVITTFNRPDALIRILNSLEEQIKMPYEVIVADDGSGPETTECIARFSTRSPCTLHHVWQSDKGFRLARIRNKAIRKATGDYIIFLDGDCIIPRHFIKDHFFLAKEGFFIQGKRVLVGKRVVGAFDHNGANSFFRLLKFMIRGDLSNIHHLIRLPFYPATSSKSLGGTRGCNMGIFKKDLHAVNGFNEDFMGWGREDSEFAVRLYHYGIKRKQHPFMAICFHLWHKEPSKAHLAVNDKILEKAMSSNDYFCPNGLVKN